MGLLSALGAIAAPFARGQRGLNLLAGSYARRAGTRDGSRQPALAARPGSAWRPCAGSLGTAGRSWGPLGGRWAGAGRGLSGRAPTPIPANSPQFLRVGTASQLRCRCFRLGTKRLGVLGDPIQQVRPLGIEFLFQPHQTTAQQLTRESHRPRSTLVRDSRAPRPPTAPSAPPHPLFSARSRSPARPGDRQ